MGKRIEVGVLGATGMVGQQFIQALAGHPWFELTWLAASERSLGKTYAGAAPWRLETPIPEGIPGRTLGACTPGPGARARGNRPPIAPNPSCSTVVLSMALAPLRAFGLRACLVSTMQAVSGAGDPGVPSLDILGNVIPFISGEEEKIETETRKILGALRGEAVEPHPVRVSAHTNRV